MAATETRQPSALPDSSPPGIPDWPAAEQPCPGAAPAGPGSEQAGPASAERLGNQTGWPLGATWQISHFQRPNRFVS